MRPDIDDIRTENGTLPAFAWPGGYPMYYVTTDGCVLCPSCANEAPVEDLDTWDIHFEGQPLI